MVHCELFDFLWAHLHMPTQQTARCNYKFSEARKMGDIHSLPLEGVIVLVCEYIVYYGQGSCIIGVLLCKQKLFMCEFCNRGF
jgi:hypothetical protein